MHGAAGWKKYRGVSAGGKIAKTFSEPQDLHAI